MRCHIYLRSQASLNLWQDPLTHPVPPVQSLNLASRLSVKLIRVAESHLLEHLTLSLKAQTLGLSLGELEIVAHDALQDFTPLELLNLSLQFFFLEMDPFVLALRCLHRIVREHACCEEFLRESAFHRRDLALRCH